MATKKKETEQALANWNANQPESYNDRYSGQINNVLQTLAGRDFTKGYSTGTDANYANYAKNYTAAAQAAAQNAKATAAALSGGYGSSYADSVAAQAYQDNMMGMNNIIPTLRAQALDEYQADTNNLETLLSGLQTASNSAYNAYSANVANYQNWRDALTTDAEQEKTNSDNFWSNVMSALQWAAKAGLGAYDAYKGYTQQEWENQFQEQQYADSQAQQQANYMALGYQAAEAGQTDLANQYGNLAGLGEGYFTNYTPTTSAMTYSDVADALSSAAGMKAYGANDAAAAILQAAGLDSSLLNGYNPLALKTSTSSGSSKSSSSSSSSSTTRDAATGWTPSEYVTAASKYDSMEDSNPAKSVLGQMLAAYGTSSTGSSDSTASYTTGSGYSPTTQDINYARQIQHYGGTDNQIMQGLKSAGYTNEQILAIMNMM